MIHGHLSYTRISTTLTDVTNRQAILFDFMAAADVIDLLIMAAERLKDLERGILGSGVYTSIFG